MFEMFGSKRSSLSELLRSIPEAPMYTSYPVVREQCSCGGYSEIVAKDDALTESHFVKWRRDHKCTSSTKKDSASPSKGAPAS